jgi:hypothetical protein
MLPSEGARRPPEPQSGKLLRTCGAGILVCELHRFRNVDTGGTGPYNDHYRRRIFTIDEDLLGKFDRILLT